VLGDFVFPTDPQDRNYGRVGKVVRVLDRARFFPPHYHVQFTPEGSPFNYRAGDLWPVKPDEETEYRWCLHEIAK
jgi:hypothetical protein